MNRVILDGVMCGDSYDPRGLGVLVGGDGVHPTTDGYTLWRDTMIQWLSAATGIV